MKNLLKLSISCLLIFILSYGVSYAQTILYGAVSEGCGDVSVNSSLYTINPVTAQAVEVGPTGFDGVSALAFLGDGRLVASANDDAGGAEIAVLIEISRTTGQGSLIGTIGNSDVAGCGRVPGLTYDSSTNTLWGMGAKCFPGGGASKQLININQTTGQGTIIGDTGSNGAGNGIAIRKDGTIFMTSNPGVIEGLFTVNSLNGQTTLVAELETTPPEGNIVINSLAFHPVTGELFGSENNFPDSELATINTENGAVNKIGDLPDCTDGLAYTPIRISTVPTLSEWGLVTMAAILGILGFIVIRRRQTTA